MDKPRDLKEAANWLGVSESWLTKQCAARAVPHTRVARKILFTAEHLAKILADGEEPLATAPAGVIQIRTRTRRTA